MQDVILCNFRKRLSSRGYTDISIKRCKVHQSCYITTCKEPLAKTVVRAEYSLFAYNNLIR